MKKACFLLACALAALTLPAQVVISPNNPANPHASAMLDVQSTDKGMLVPRMTTAQRTAIANPAKGLLVFDTNTNTFWFYNGSAWGPVDGNTVPSTGIILSETENNPALTAAGFSLIGETKMTYQPVNGATIPPFAWTGVTATDNAPENLSEFSSVWTGTEMIVWGGSTIAGGRYDPVLDKWTSTSLINAPSPRMAHSAIWTGTDMIIWGGYLGGTSYNTGFRYNPDTDTWSPISITNAPSPRYGHTAIWTGTEMIIWGGSSGSGGYANGGRYDPTTDTWTTISSISAPAAWIGHTAVWTGAEMIIWGGAATTLVNTGGRYNPANDSWTPTNLTNAPSARGGHTSVWTGTEMIVWGGGAGGVFNDGGRYNPASNTWSPLPLVNAPVGRWQHTAVWTGSDMIVWGGRANYFNNWSTFNSGSWYNPSSNTWSTLTILNAPIGKYNHGAIWTGKAMIVWGGQDSSTTMSRTGGIVSPSQNKTLYLFQKN